MGGILIRSRSVDLLIVEKNFQLVDDLVNKVEKSIKSGPSNQDPNPQSTAEISASEEKYFHLKIEG